MGLVKVPEEAYYGAQTQRAVENFPISGWRFGREFIFALGLIKYASVKANSELGLLGGKNCRGYREGLCRSNGGKMGRTICGRYLSNRLWDID